MKEPENKQGQAEFKSVEIKQSMYTRMRKGGVIQSVPNKDVKDFEKKGFTVV